MYTKEYIPCSLCGKLSELTINKGPLWGLKFNPYWLGGYSEFVDHIPEPTPKSQGPEDQMTCLCHDCSLQLFRFLKVKPEPVWHPWTSQATPCCEYGYDPTKYE